MRLRNIGKFIFDRMDDKTYLGLRYKYATGKRINWSEPKEFNEKLMWLMINDRNPKYIDLVDKLKVKDIIAKKFGSEYVIPLITVGNRFEDIDLNKLPQKFVIKCNHDSGGIIICKDKETLDIEKAKSLINGNLDRDFFSITREWPNSKVEKKVIVEEYMEDNSPDSNGELKDYKFYCFNGEPKFLYLSQGLTNHKTARINYVNLNWEIEPFYRKDYLQFEKLPEKPIQFEKMIEFSRILAENIPFVRVDWYEINGLLYFGEMTFYPGAGITDFYPNEWNRKIGDYLLLPL